MTEIHRGALLAGRFRCHSRLATGGNVSVWKAQDTLQSVPVVVKVPRVCARSSAGWSAFDHRAAILQRLTEGSTPTLVPTVFDIGTLESGRPYLVQSFVERGLRDGLQRGDPRETLCSLGKQLCQFAHVLHQIGLVHTDLTPQNVGRTESGAYCVLDYGAVRELTACPNCGGTPAAGASIHCPACGASFSEDSPQLELPPDSYRPPEIATTGVVGPWSDVYSIGRILRDAESWLGYSTGSLIAPSILKRATTTPANRYQRPSDLACALESVLTSSPESD